MEMSFSTSGMGTSGVYSHCFTFAVPYREHQSYATEFPGGAPVMLSGSGSAPKFYVSSKTCSDGVAVRVTCYDRMTYTEAEFPCTEEDFIDSTTGEEIPMSLGTALGRICTECGFLSYWLNDDDLPDAVPTLEKSFLCGKTCRDILSALSEAFCGYWCVSGGSVESLMFVPFGIDVRSIGAVTLTSEYHETVKENSHAVITNVYLTDNIDEYGTDTGGIETVCIETPLANAALYQALSERIACVYNGVKCGNAFLSGLPQMPMIVSFTGQGGTRYINYCSAKISSDGILADLGLNSVDEGEWVYKTRTRRELEDRYKEGDVWKNVQITKKGGLSIVYQNLNN